MRVLVTGASGFLGCEVVSQLKRSGFFVITSDRSGGVDFKGDLADHAFAMSLPACDVVVHSAAVQYVSRDLPLLSRGRYFQCNNVQATANLCERYANDAIHMVNIGTSMMYRQSGQTSYSTQSPMEGQGVYSQSKLAALALIERASFSSATVVPCIIGGPGREGLFRRFVGSMVRHGKVLVPGTGRHLIHMVHVTDVADLVVKAVQRRAVGLFNAAGPEPLSIHQWIDEIEAALSLSPVRRLQLPLSPIALLSRTSAYRLLAREQVLMLGQAHVLAVDESLALGWRPQHTNKAIVRDIATYLQATAPP